METKLVIALLALFLSSGCGTSPEIETTSMSTITPQPQVTVEGQDTSIEFLTTTPTATQRAPSISPTPPTTPFTELSTFYRQACVAIETSTGQNAMSTGELIFFMPGGIWTLRQSRSTPELVIENTQAIKISPYSGAMAWIDNEKINYLGQFQAEFPYPSEGDWFSIRQWLADDRMIINLGQSDEGSTIPAADRFFILDPFTGELTYHEFSFPGFIETDLVTNHKPVPVYDPYLKYAVYVRVLDTDPFLSEPEMILWDIAQERELWLLGNWGWPIGFSEITWQSNGNSFIGVTRSLVDELTNYPTLIQVSIDGRASELTNIQDLGLETENGFYDLKNPVISPNGRYVMHPETWTVALNKINYCANQGVQNGKNKKNIQRRVQVESGIGNHQRQQEHGRGMPRIQSESGPALALETSVFGQCFQSI